MVSISALESLRIEEADLSSGALSLEADTSESLMVLARGVTGEADDTVFQESIDEETMLAYPGNASGGNVFPEATPKRLQTDIHGKLRDMGLAAPRLKVPEGDEYRLTNSDGAGTAIVLYREMAATGVTDGQPGTPGSKTRTFVTSAQETVNVASNGTETVEVTNSSNPGILRDFPYTETVPAGREYDLQALMVNLNDGLSGADAQIDGIRLQSEEREFLARESDFPGADIADFPNTSLTELPLVFGAEPTFSPGDELDLELEVSNTGGSAQDVVADVSMVFYRRGVGVSR